VKRSDPERNTLHEIRFTLCDASRFTSEAPTETMPTLSIRTLTAASNKAKVAADERSYFFREQYRHHSLGLAGKKNAYGREYTQVEGGNHTSRKALKGALERLAESPTAPQDTDVVIIADHAFLEDGSEEERKIIKEGGKDKVAKDEVEREGVRKLLETFRNKFRKITVMFEKSPEGPRDSEALDKRLQTLQCLDESGNSHVAYVLHCRNEVPPETYARFIRSAAGMAP
jgi:hypothetical protein